MTYNVKLYAGEILFYSVQCIMMECLLCCIPDMMIRIIALILAPLFYVIYVGMISAREETPTNNFIKSIEIGNDKCLTRHYDGCISLSKKEYNEKGWYWKTIKEYTIEKQIQLILEQYPSLKQMGLTKDEYIKQVFGENLPLHIYPDGRIYANCRGVYTPATHERPSSLMDIEKEYIDYPYKLQISRSGMVKEFIEVDNVSYKIRTISTDNPMFKHILENYIQRRE